MNTTLSPLDPCTLRCKHLVELPPIVTEWQQSFQQPRCLHYCQGECCNPTRRVESAPCPFDGKELLLEEAEPSNDDNFPSCAGLGLPKKG